MATPAGAIYELRLLVSWSLGLAEKAKSSSAAPCSRGRWGYQIFNQGLRRGGLRGLDKTK